MNGNHTDTYNLIYNLVIARLQNGLPTHFTYHGLAHTKDVLEQCMVIAKNEGVTNEDDLLLLKMAALYHDTGFLHVYSGHEAKGCEMCRQELPSFGFTEEQIEKICGMIMATKIPQSPHNLLEEIICDADLDYLGRDDFDPISTSLYEEFTTFGFVKDFEDWMRKQIGFFESHHYFTNYSNRVRQPKKLEQLEKIKAYFQKTN